MESALGRVLAAPCATHFGALALLRHLRWHIEHDRITDARVHLRAFDLALYLNLDVRAVVTLPQKLRGSHTRSAIHLAGEFAAALVLIVGGMAAVGLASLV
jgi:hypothetical protein